MRRLRVVLAGLALAGLVPGCAPHRLSRGDTSPPDRWYRGNIHTHSLWSDGDDFPEMIADWYSEQGYHFLALSDHNVLSRGERWMPVSEIERRGGQVALEEYVERFGDDWVERRTTDRGLEVRLRPLAEFRGRVEEPGRFLMIEGEEITDAFEKRPVHMNATNLQEVIEPRGGSSVRDVIRRNLRAVRSQEERTGEPILVHLNHPNFGWAVTAEDLAAVVEERFYEVYNGHPGVRHRGDATHAGVERLWDIANTLRIAELGAPPLYGVAVDDTHDYHGSDGATPGRGWIMVRSPELSPAAIVESIRRADFYASSGVRLREIVWDPEEALLSVEVDPRPDVGYTVRFVGTREGYDASSEPARGPDGKPLPGVTRRYSEEVGEVLTEVRGPRAEYRLEGDELYVRAVVVADRPPANPVYEGQRAKAWTQPVGWEARVEVSE